jgi:hypothetical protein
MIQNAALLALLTVFLLVGWLAGELRFLASYKAALIQEYGTTIGMGTLLLFLNLCALYYGIGRWLLLRDVGRKLRHVDRQLRTPDAVHDDLRTPLTSIKD